MVTGLPLSSIVSDKLVIMKNGSAKFQVKGKEVSRKLLAGNIVRYNKALYNVCSSLPRVAIVDDLEEKIPPRTKLAAEQIFRGLQQRSVDLMTVKRDLCKGGFETSLKQVVALYNDFKG